MTRQGASAFNQPLSLDISSVTDMSYMFWVCVCNPARVCPCPAPSFGSFVCTLATVHRLRRPRTS